jgi:acyl dehydratase
MTIIDKYWDDAREGDECVSPSYTVTKERILAYADLTGDHTPVHVDEAYANASHFGSIVAHGLFGLSIADGLKTQSEFRVGASSCCRPGSSIRTVRSSSMASIV